MNRDLAPSIEGDNYFTGLGDEHGTLAYYREARHFGQAAEGEGEDEMRDAILYSNLRGDPQEPS